MIYPGVKGGETEKRLVCGKCNGKGYPTMMVHTGRKERKVFFDDGPLRGLIRSVEGEAYAVPRMEDGEEVVYTYEIEDAPRMGVHHARLVSP